MTDLLIEDGAKLGGALVKNLPVILGAAVVFAAGGAAVWKCPVIGAEAQISRANADTAKATASGQAWAALSATYQGAYQVERKAFAAERDTLKADVDNGRNAVDLQADACDSRVTAAQASALAIQAIITKEPAHDQNGAPVRELVSTDELRDALQPPAAAGQAAAPD